MSTTQALIRTSPVKIKTRQPPYCSLNERENQSFSHNLSGFGNRHCHDHAPFTFWNEIDRAFRDPTHAELLWIRQTYRATSIHIAFPHMCIKTLHPPRPIPCTVAAALVRFGPPDVSVELTPPFTSRPYGDQKNDVLDSKLPLFDFPEPSTCVEIIKKLSVELKMRAIHFLPPIIIVELAMGSTHARHSLPGRAGGINIVYHDGPTSYWAGTVEKAYSRLLEPSELVQDSSDYLYMGQGILSPGVCLASAVLDSSVLLTSSWQSTTAGIMLQRGSERRISVANHGFRLSDDVNHPTPLGRRIGRIVERLPALGIGLVLLDPSISFSNGRYFQAPNPRRMIPHAQIRAGSNFEMDGISTGRLDLVAVGKSFYFDDPVPPAVEYDLVDGQNWRIELSFLVSGPTGQLARDGMCGAPFVDPKGSVGGLFQYSDASSLFAHTPALDGLIRRGWVVV